MSHAKPEPLAIALIAVQVVNAAFDAVALYPIARSTALGDRAKQWAKDDLDRLGFPDRLRFVFPIIKGSSAIGLLVGLRRPGLGRLTAALIVVYFLAAIGYHAKTRDPVSKYIPALVMLLWASGVVRSYSPEK